MLAKALGIRLQLLAGRGVPRPRPELMPALREVQVVNDADGGDGFRLTFGVTKSSAGLYGVLDDGTLDPMTRVVVAVVLGVVPEVLVDGLVTEHHVIPGDRPGEATFAVDGTDLTQQLDLEERNEPHDNQPDSTIVRTILGRYARLGLVPQVTATPDTPVQTQRVPRQHHTDLAYIRELATRNGFVFYLQPRAVLSSTAYWGPAVRTGLPAPALTTNILGFTNVRGLRFGNDALAPVSADGSYLDPVTGKAIPVPALPALRVPPLSSAPAPALRSAKLRDVAQAGPLQAALRSTARATGAAEAVSCTGDVDTLRYGAVLRARGLVGVRGAGLTYDGSYYVRRVTHKVRMGSYEQSFALSREGTGTISPVVRP